MKISVNWLKSYVSFKGSAEELAERLTFSGSEVVGVEKKGSDTLLDLEITPNRADCLSVLGLAREVGAIFSKKVKVPSFSSKKVSLPKDAITPEVKIEDKKGCTRYIARVFGNVKVDASPAWLLERVASSGTRSINNVVDITNFCLFESGQPLHAFDYDKLEGGVIIVRRAKKGETFVAIDGTEHKLDDSVLVIADAGKPVAIAGVMGGKSTEVSTSTKRILLESAFFDPVLVRRSSRKLGLSSESSYRFERGVDWHNVAWTSERAADLLISEAGAKPVSGIVEVKTTPSPKNIKISLPLSDVCRVAGYPIQKTRIKIILNCLGLKCRLSSGKFLVEVPSFRRDLRRPIDLVEEIVRIEGFDKIPLRTPKARLDLKEEVNSFSKNYHLAKKAKEVLSAFGFSEAITYSLLSAKKLEECGFLANQSIRLKNPLSLEQEFLRPGLSMGLLEAVRHNLHHKIKEIRLFEIGKVFRKPDQEELSIGILVTGLSRYHWNAKEKTSFFELKGVVENLLRTLGATDVTFSDPSSDDPLFDLSADLRVKNQVAGRVGRLSGDKKGIWDLESDLFFAEIFPERIFRDKGLGVRYSPLPIFPSVRRDLSVLVDLSLKASELESLIRSAAEGFVYQVKLFDEFKGDKIPLSKRSLSFSIEYHKPDGTFTDEEIERLHQKVIEALKTQVRAELR